jgi:putative ABC transport system permease protein
LKAAANHLIIFREWFNHKVYPLLFILCMLVSLGAYLTLDALQFGVDEYVQDNQKQIVGGDLVIESKQAFPDNLIQRLAQLEPSAVVYDYQFNAIAYTQQDSLLTRIKAVNSNYPLYGKMTLSSGQSLIQAWPKNTILVEQQVLTGLKVKIGDSIKIGEIDFKIADEILIEPDRPLTAFGFGARVLMHEEDLQATGLMGQRSRINYRIEIKADVESLPTILADLNEITKETKINVTTAQDSNTSISALSQNFLKFLKLLVIAVIVLSGIGIMSIIKAFVSRQQKTNSIRRALGEPVTSIVNSYRWLLSVMALISVALAWIMSLAVLKLGDDIFAAILPVDLVLYVSWVSLIKATFIALILTWLMTSLTLESLHEIKPVAALHQHDNKAQKRKLRKSTRIIWALVATVGLMLLLYSETNSWSQSLQIFIGLALIWGAFLFLTWVLMRLLKRALVKNWISSWLARLALQNIFRKGNQSTLFITALSMTTMVLGTITMLDYSIQQQLISTYPEEAPNMFLLDVQTDQQEEISQIVGESIVYYPVIRARIDSVNGVKAEDLKSQLGRYDDILRIFNLSYGNQVMETEKVTDSVNGTELFGSKIPKTVDQESVPISILNSIADYLQVGIGDEITFNIQGVKIKTHIDSIRERYKRGPSPFFYFVFQPEVMAQAPQIRFATAKVNLEDTAKLQTQIAKRFPGITTLDGGSIAIKLKGFVDQLKQLVQVFTALSLFAGLLIFATSLVATSQDRLRESHYYRLMGMSGQDLSRLSRIEFVTLGIFAFGLGALISTIISYLITTQWFALEFIFPWSLFGMAMMLLILILLLISSIYSRYVRASKVIHFIQSEA